MIVRGKKYQAAKEKIVEQEAVSCNQAVQAVKDAAYAKFDESVDVNIHLGIDPAKGEHAVRGSVVLPHQFGNDVKVLVFATGEYADKATQSGADFVGADDLLEKISGGWLEFDYAVATPDVMAKVGKVARILGPRGLLPSKKNGTVTFDVAAVVSDLKKGRKFFKNDKLGGIQFSFGKVSMGADQLQENLVVFLKALSASKPSSAKGVFLRKAIITSTMGPGVKINPQEIVAS